MVSFDFHQILVWPWGVLNTIEIIAGILTMISGWTVDWPVRGTSIVLWFAGTATLNTIIRLALYIVHYDEIVIRIWWVISDLAMCIIWFAMYVISVFISISGMSKGHDRGSYGSMMLFSCIGFLAFGYNAYLRFVEYKLIKQEGTEQYISQAPANVQVNVQVTAGNPADMNPPYPTTVIGQPNYPPPSYPEATMMKY